jgi:hypothetical protein
MYIATTFKGLKMYFIINDDIEVDDELHLHHGDILSLFEMQNVLAQCELVSAICFASQELALEYNRTEGYTI